MRGVVAVMAVAVALAGCATPLQSPPPSRQASPELQIATERTDATCMQAAIGAPRVTLMLDPSRSTHILAVADDGTRFPIVWPDGFSVGDRDGPVVLDARGRVAGANGDVIVVPDAAMPNLRGRMVCYGDDTLWVMATIDDVAASRS